jgi:6-phosphogluconolactonase (cycloisomerase 2 family)
MSKNAFLAGVAATLVLGAAACSSDQPPTPGPAAVYTTNWASNTIAEFPANPDGSLRGPAISISAGPGPTHPQGSVRSHDGTWLYVSNWGTAGITPFRIGPDGTLTASPTVPGPAPAPVTPSGIALSPDGGHLYTANFSNGAAGTISEYRVSADGLPHGVITVAAHGQGTTGVAISSDEHTLVSANSGSGDLSVFRIAPDGSLDRVRTLATGGGAFFAAITPDSQRVLVTNSAVNTISLVSLASGSVSTVADPADDPHGIVLDATGRHAYVANFAKGTGPGFITTFAIDATGIHLIGRPVSSGGNGAEGIALSHDGKTLYNANYNATGPGSVTSYPIAPDGTVGTGRPPVPTGGRQPDLGSITVSGR